jgi:hypothetical protein
MSNIFTLENFTDFSEKINIDELYDKKRQVDLKKLEVYKKVLNRIHVRIKTVAKKSTTEKFCWYVIPQMIIGVPTYNQANCIAYVMRTLEDNGFKVRYFHPNTVFISWDHWVPSYVRTEIKKSTGISLNEYGERIDNEEDYNSDENETELVNNQTITQISNSKKYTPINSYKPSGKLVYSEDLLNKIENKISR